VAVVNDVLARHYWPNQSAVGKRLRLNDDQGREIEIVGIARARTYLRLGEGPAEYLYLPLAQNIHSRMTLVVQSFGDAASLVPELLQTVRGLDANLPVYDVRTMGDFYQEGAVSQPNLSNQVVGCYGSYRAAYGAGGLVRAHVLRSRPPHP
jgi:hypothetical protein